MSKSDININDSYKNELIEKCADIEHDRWSNWHLYLVSKCIKNEDGTLTLPKWAVDRWERQATTKYKNLTEKEKDTDRKEVDTYLPTICKHAITQLFNRNNLK